MLPPAECVFALFSRRLFGSCFRVFSRRRCSISAFMREAAGFEGVSDRATLQEFSVSNSGKFWAAAARHRLSWIRTFDEVQDCDLSRGKINWFGGGKLNVSGKIASIIYQLLKFEAVKLSGNKTIYGQTSATNYCNRDLSWLRKQKLSTKL